MRQRRISSNYLEGTPPYEVANNDQVVYILFNSLGTNENIVNIFSHKIKILEKTFRHSLKDRRCIHKFKWHLFKLERSEFVTKRGIFPSALR